MSYDIFSNYYDLLMQNAGYSERVDHYRKILTDNGIKSGILLDLGCGTGTMSLLMAKAGYEVIGIDSSVGMLMKAKEKANKENVDLLLLNQDMEDLDLYGTVDCTISAFDCINHLDSLNTVKKVFEKVSLFTVPGGVFIFDVNTVFKHRNILADNSYIFESENVFCAWQNSLNEDNSVDITLDFFEKSGNSYKRETEYFSEIAFSSEELTSALYDAGFDIKSIFDDLTDNPVNETSQKAVFVAVKR